MSPLSSKHSLPSELRSSAMSCTTNMLAAADMNTSSQEVEVCNALTPHREAAQDAETTAVAMPALEEILTIDNYILFCSEHLTFTGHYLSNWYNQGYASGTYGGEDGNFYWCSEMDLMARKLHYCRNTELAQQKMRRAIVCNIVSEIRLLRHGQV